MAPKGSSEGGTDGKRERRSLWWRTGVYGSPDTPQEYWTQQMGNYAGYISHKKIQVWIL